MMSIKKILFKLLIKLTMKKLINYFTPVGDEQIAIAKAFLIVASVTLSILFLFTFLEFIL